MVDSVAAEWVGTDRRAVRGALGERALPEIPPMTNALRWPCQVAWVNSCGRSVTQPSAGADMHFLHVSEGSLRAEQYKICGDGYGSGR